MAMYGHQKTIIVEKAKSDANNVYSIYNFAANYKALTTLNPHEYKVWSYLNANVGGRRFALSSKHGCEICNMCRQTFCKAINGLIEKGYLIEVVLEDDKTGYIFMEAGGEEK